MITKTSTLISIAILLLHLSSCNDFNDINTDPNNAVEVPAENLLTQAEFVLNNRLWGRNFNADWAMLMVQHWGENEYILESLFYVDGHDFNLDCIELYSEVLKELKSAGEIITADDDLQTNVKTNQLAVISILEVYTFHNLTDAYGDIVYNEALDPGQFPLPAYDNQAAVYSDLISKLKTAISNIDASTGSFLSGEVIYGGDMTSWKKFANSLLLRIAMRMSFKDEAAATTAINGLSISDLITSNSDNAMFVFETNPLIANPLYVDSEINNRDDFSVSATLIDKLKAIDDPRLEAFASVNNFGEYIGMPIDEPPYDFVSTASRPSLSVRAATSPAILLDAAEVNFLLAEAYQRNLLNGDASLAYANGITASMNYWEISDTEAINTYIAANPYDESNWKESIGTQKWFAFYMNGPQAWAEWRRLGYPVLSTPANAVLQAIPVRLPYPFSEQTLNRASLEAVDNGNPDDLSTRMWWDVD